MLYASVINLDERMMMKAIFLDVDGVLNNWDTVERHGGYIGIDPVKVAMLHRIIDETGCVLVLSSTWRLTGHMAQHVYDMVGAEYFVGQTIDHGRGYNLRPNEIVEWIDHNVINEDLFHYAILDDDFDWNDGQHIFRTSMNVGLTDEIAQAVIDHLNGA